MDGSWTCHCLNDAEERLAARGNISGVVQAVRSEPRTQIPDEQRLAGTLLAGRRGRSSGSSKVHAASVEQWHLRVLSLPLLRHLLFACYTQTMTSSDTSPPGRLAGIDYGTVRIGIAITDSRQTLASPYENYQRRDPQRDAERFQRLATEEGIRTFVVGLPVHLDGRESQKSIEAREFGKWLQEVTGIPVQFFDERFTSHEAEQILGGAELTKKKRKARLDMLAAQIMLASYLESRSRGQDVPRGLDE